MNAPHGALHMPRRPYPHERRICAAKKRALREIPYFQATRQSSQQKFRPWQLMNGNAFIIPGRSLFRQNEDCHLMATLHQHMTDALHVTPQSASRILLIGIFMRYEANVQWM